MSYDPNKKLYERLLAQATNRNVNLSKDLVIVSCLRDEAMQVDTNLFKVEEVILSSLRHEIQDMPILDIGVADGRTTGHLKAISSDYVGIDYSEGMIELCKTRVRDATLLVCDARNMSIFEDERFAAVFFLWNSIGCVDPPGRDLILKEIRRVLKSNGIFVFSAHNLDWWERQPLALISGLSWSDDLVTFLPNPIALIKETARCFRVYVHGLFNRVRSKIRDRGYAIVLEHAELPGSVMPRYYIQEQAQVRQLLDAGFHQVKTLAIDGGPTNSASRASDYFIYYVARKK